MNITDPHHVHASSRRLQNIGSPSFDTQPHNGERSNEIVESHNGQRVHSSENPSITVTAQNSERSLVSNRPLSSEQSDSSARPRIGRKPCKSATPHSSEISHNTEEPHTSRRRHSRETLHGHRRPHNTVTATYRSEGPCGSSETAHSSRPHNSGRPHSGRRQHSSERTRADRRPHTATATTYSSERPRGSSETTLSSRPHNSGRSNSGRRQHSSEKTRGNRRPHTAAASHTSIQPSSSVVSNHEVASHTASESASYRGAKPRSTRSRVKPPVELPNETGGREMAESDVSNFLRLSDMLEQLYFEQHNIEILVKYNRRLIKVELIPMTSVLELKRKLEYKTDVKRNQQILTFVGSKLEEHFSLADYNIIKGSMVYLTMEELFIFVQPKGQDMFKLFVQRSDSIWDVKLAIEKLRGFDSSGYNLFLAGERLGDYYAVEDYNIERGCHLSMVELSPHMQNGVNGQSAAR